MINLTERKINRFKIGIIILSSILLLISLTQIAYRFGKNEEDEYLAAYAFFFGWMDIFGPGISWLANFFLIGSWILLFQNSKYSQYFSILAILFCLSFMLFKQVAADESGIKRLIVSYGLGYWLWLSSCAINFIGILVLRNKNSC